MKIKSRVKSLSKGSNPKKDVLPPTLNLKESTTVPLSSVLPTSSNFEDDQDGSDDFDAPEETYEPPKPVWKKNGKLEPYNIPTTDDKLRRPNGQTQTKWNEIPRNSHSDDDLSALLQVTTSRRLIVVIC